MSSFSSHHCDQLNSTALKWSNDGELSALDLERIMERLTTVDPALQALGQESNNPGGMGN
ncbi:hypothetical protein KBY58_12625 [Cyanobium sp. HWJ4-Hawea]|uniref:hypothetical protein n=1 Tax=Cyanobium sp. HWJ4-Hawea TaxID=2823713 RepID=UPI0020CCCFA4|nr:hypothetical protein [Cyanobium sp. HWJ4-Hawea]MCP9810272.1 hypothetical protein [Cyanobium sp. HWJ4-Hawea]